MTPKWIRILYNTIIILLLRVSSYLIAGLYGCVQVAVRYHVRVFMDWRRINCIVRVVHPPKTTDKLYMDLVQLDDNNNVLHQLRAHGNSCQATSGPGSSAMHSTLARRDHTRRTAQFPRRLSSIQDASSEEPGSGGSSGNYDLLLSRISNDTVPENDTIIVHSSELCVIRETSV